MAITPLGDLASFDSVRQDDSPGASLSLEEARALSQKFLTPSGLGQDLKSIEATPTERPHRRDWRFVDEKPDFKMADATIRYETVVAGSELTGFREFVHVPESWTRDYSKLRSKNETANVIGNFALIVTFLVMLVVLITRIVRRDVRWRVVGGFGLVAFLLSLLAIFNNLPLALRLRHGEPALSHIATRIVSGILAPLESAQGLASSSRQRNLSTASAFLDSSRFQAFSRRGLRSKRFFLGLRWLRADRVLLCLSGGLLRGCGETGRVGARRIPYDDILNTAIPWVTVLFVGFLPAVLEEVPAGCFRFLPRQARRRPVRRPSCPRSSGASTTPTPPAFHIEASRSD